MSDGKYFSTTKKGEIVEFRQDLHSLDRSKKKEAVKKVIAAMTVGKDVSILFPDVVNCMQTDDLELKKLVYLYLINYAKTQPDLAIMGVNTFVKDSQDPNPLIRALAVRTMGCIRVDKITEYLCDPLQRTLKDEDPYVRKTAAMCVAKLHDINAELVEDRGFLDSLKDLLADSNPMVVANAVAALAEIQEVSSTNVMPLNQSAHGKLLRALNECTEWGQVFILDSLASYSATDAKEAEGIIERVAPRLQHANSAVVLSAIKVILKQLEVASDENLKLSMHKKMAPPLITLLGGESELQYVALRNISLIVQKYPQLLSQEVKVFFCKYNDPIYVKMEKLEIMIRLANERNVDQVLLEFKEYATEVDVDFVRKAVRAIGRCAVSLNDAAERCINVLLELIKTKVEYVVQESIVVIKDIFRRYPNRYESIIATLCENLETLDEPEAKASMIWIIGEYAERIDNADELLEFFLETFPEESSQVQLQLITAAVKLFLKKPTARPQQMIQLVLTYATQETDNPDLRDRAYVYWRLLSTDPEAAKEVVLAEKPNIDDSSSQMEPALLESLLKNLSSLSSVYHKPPDAFVSRTRVAVQKAEDLQPIQQQMESNAASPITDQGAQGQAVPDLMGDLLDLGDDSAPSHIADTQNFAAQPAIGPSDILTDLNELDVNQGAIAAPSASFGGALSGLSADLRPEASRARLSVVLDANAGKGLTVSARLSSQDNRPVYLLEFQNGTAGALDTFMIQFNKNSFGLAPANQSIAIATIQPGAAAKATVPLLQSQDLLSPAAASAILQVAIRNKQQGVFYYSDSILVDAVVDRQATLQPSAFIPLWRELSDANEAIQTISHSSNVDAILSALSQTFTLQARKQLPGGGEVAFLAAKLRTLPVPVDVLVELRFSATQIRAAVKTARSDISKLAVDGLQQLVNSSDSGL